MDSTGQFPPHPSSISTEADVEVQVLYPLLTLSQPVGLGYSNQQVRSKTSIRKLSIDKGNHKKLYFPDFIIVIHSLPVIVVEAKSPGEDLVEAAREGRLYATELNALFPSGINPVTHVLVSDGNTISLYPSDSECSLATFPTLECIPSSPSLEIVQRSISKARLAEYAAKLAEQIKPRYIKSALQEIGGVSVRNEQIGVNEFGAALALEFRHIFNPASEVERENIVKYGYIHSARKQRYQHTIDSIIEAVAPPVLAEAKNIKDNTKPDELLEVLRRDRSLIEHKVLLLVGGVGSGKSTFVDHLRLVALSDDIKRRTTWIYVDMNNSPTNKNLLDAWVIEQMIEGLMRSVPDTDFDSLDTMKKVCNVEIRKFQKGPALLLVPDSMEYNRGLFDFLSALQKDRIAYLRALCRYCCAERGRLLIVVFDNCDQRDRERQLQMFQVSQWIQREFRSLVILPIRDITYEAFRDQPPLDTALKELIFRIEPPPFSGVLHRRIQMALGELAEREGRLSSKSYSLPNGMIVTYPGSELGLYLASILRSVFEYNSFVRRILVGVAGKNIRKALEIFLLFCQSGHISTNEILQIRHNDGNYVLPLPVIMRVLLRGSRRFYDGDESSVKNLFMPNLAEDPRPNYFLRFAILDWLKKRFHLTGPNYTKGFHRCDNMIDDLSQAGLDAKALLRELNYLIRAGLVISEHLNAETVGGSDLVIIGPAGHTHLDLSSSIDYLAACAEETPIGRNEAVLIAGIISDTHQHSSHSGQLHIADIYTEYLDSAKNQIELEVASYLESDSDSPLIGFRFIRDKVISEREKAAHDPWFSIRNRYKARQEYTAKVVSHKDFGLFVRLEAGVDALLHANALSRVGLADRTLWPIVGKMIVVRVYSIQPDKKRISVDYVSDETQQQGVDDRPL